MKIAEKKDYRPQVGDNDEENGLALKAIVIKNIYQFFSINAFRISNESPTVYEEKMRR